MGSDVFLNCFALETLVIRARPEQATGLFALVACITEAVQALFWPEGEARPLAGLWYPAYWEDIEETPAHILLHTFSGQGYHYRAFLAANTGRVLARLLKAQDMDGLRALLALDVFEKDAFAAGAALAAKADNASAAALLADAEHKKFAARPNKKRYDFDF